MATKPAILLVILVIITPSLQDLPNNNIDDPIEQAKADIFKEQTLQNVGNMLNSFVNSEGAAQLGNILTTAASGEKAGEILQGLGSVIGQVKGLDPSMLGMVMNMVQPPSTKSEEGLDLNTIMGLAGALMGGDSPKNINLWSYIPMILQTANAFFGPEADARAKSHSDHAGLVPPIIEKLHLLFDHFVNSEMGKQLFATLGAEKFIKFFADENGRMSYRRFVDMLENHSVRKHWIQMVTNKIAGIISHFSEPRAQKRYLTTFQHFLNSVLKSQGYPKVALFDQNRPVDSLTALINHFAKEYFHIQISSKQYVKTIVEYIQELFRLADKRGMLNVDSNKLSDKLADTINLEIIEPIARVNRAFRFAQKVPQCDKYVMCLVNREPDEGRGPSLPGLRPLLSQSSSFVYSWFLSSVTKTAYWDLYKAITSEKDCQRLYVDACHDFHLEEIKVKKEYVHNEL